MDGALVTNPLLGVLIDRRLLRRRNGRGGGQLGEMCRPSSMRSVVLRVVAVARGPKLTKA
jgi:hypothetical protein